ncbi:DUF6445 family protein [Luteimonas sp. 3794]|uniref:DUF6445 family protein n=1 Tax=Luteimonas sp. 3794 TaxID=2817730 RepID=UPI0028655714|nr:DUF6445 family protein [Luteimonas sp. 3794]MDR6992471.1 hypothetical protein [Luteimonas sp. 3794]
MIDSFLPASVRQAGLCAQFVDWPGPDGEVYKRVALVEVPGLCAAIEARCGPVDMLGMGYRLNFNGETPNHAVHSDMGWGTHAAVVYLSEGEGGTAFWRHNATGAERIDPGNVDLYDQIKGDWNDESKWEMTQLVEMRLGRGLIYESSRFHSRYPFAAFGSGPEDGRLIAIAFFSPR